MDKNRLWVIGAVLAIGAIVVLGWMLGISPKLTEVGALQSERDAALAQNTAYEVQDATLKKQFEGLGALTGDLLDMQRSVPTSVEAPALITELTSIAASSQVVLSALNQNDAQAFDPALLAVAAPAAGTAASPSTATDAAAVAADAATGGVAGAVPVPTVDPRITATNFNAIPIAITVDGPYDKVLDFVSGLQHGTRLIMVTAVSTTVPGPEGAVTGTINALVYVLVNPSAAAPTAP
ncbi:hypothetical protein JF66_14275 [Cryobacterium sp. MLB-32]|uniref:hypothetical protein n=1 Tax=Cryobacterium sp. MLB-32 TaxID=1529318 RepID=UPI0004E65C9B|nr:hypothetical protein [Cryobacterium sp. MLB-32]KFF59020.1 hypothetical protein JF66_14275 [Cryobacterium sp. MLB-32]